jgi:hypothetical protein
MLEAVFHSVATFRTLIYNAVMADRGVYPADGHKENHHTADC